MWAAESCGGKVMKEFVFTFLKTTAWSKLEHCSVLVFLGRSDGYVTKGNDK